MGKYQKKKEFQSLIENEISTTVPPLIFVIILDALKKKLNIVRT